MCLNSMCNFSSGNKRKYAHGGTLVPSDPSYIHTLLILRAYIVCVYVCIYALKSTYI